MYQGNTEISMDEMVSPEIFAFKINSVTLYFHRSNVNFFRKPEKQNNKNSTKRVKNLRFAASAYY